MGRVLHQAVPGGRAASPDDPSVIANACEAAPYRLSENYDEKALAVYKQAMPDHTIVGIPGKPEFPWLGTDALHCRTHGVPRDVIDAWLRSQEPA